jgi:hypothetical protein
MVAARLTPGSRHQNRTAADLLLFTNAHCAGERMDERLTIRCVGRRLDLLAARDGPLAATGAAAPHDRDGVALHRRFGGRRPDGAAEGTLRRNTKPDRSLGHWEGGSLSHRLRSYLLPFSVVTMVDVDGSARLQQALRNGHRGIACGLRCDGRLADEIAGLDDGCRYPDFRCGMVNQHVADFRARTPRCTHKDPPGLLDAIRSVQKHRPTKSANSAGYASEDEAESRR